MSLIVCCTLGRTLSAVRPCPAVTAHTDIRRDTRPSILTGRGANSCTEIDGIADWCAKRHYTAFRELTRDAVPFHQPIATAPTSIWRHTCNTAIGSGGTEGWSRKEIPRATIPPVVLVDTGPQSCHYRLFTKTTAQHYTSFFSVVYPSLLSPKEQSCPAHPPVHLHLSGAKQ